MPYINLSIEGLWSFLGNSIAQLFGRECASAALWMIYCLLLRQITSLLYLQSFVPYGLIFALPYSMYLFGKYCPMMKHSLPLLPLRVAEAILGRLTPLQLTIVIPAHFLGCIFAVSLFRCLNPFSSLAALQPITYSTDLSLPIILSDALLVAIYTTACLVVPELLTVNKLHSAYLSLAVLPFISGVRNGGTFHPAGLYALTFVHSISSNATNAVHYAYVLPPLIGAITAGIICLRYFPDDPTSWKRK